MAKRKKKDEEVNVKSRDSEKHNYSKNSQLLQREPPRQESQKKLDGDHCEQGLGQTSECSKQLPNSHEEMILQENDILPSRVQTSHQSFPDVQITNDGDSSKSS